MNKKKKNRFSKNIRIKNRKASFEYQFIETYESGIMLKGTEIKSVREGNVSLQEAYCMFRKNELFIKGMNIASYDQASFSNHQSTRERKLLLKKKELQKLQDKSKEKSLSIIPTKLYINNRGLTKLEIALAKGKKIYDKREDIKKRDQQRDLDSIKFETN